MTDKSTVYSRTPKPAALTHDELLNDLELFMMGLRTRIVRLAREHHADMAVIVRDELTRIDRDLVHWVQYIRGR